MFNIAVEVKAVVRVVPCGLGVIVEYPTLEEALMYAYTLECASDIYRIVKDGEKVISMCGIGGVSAGHVYTKLGQ